MSMKQDEEKGTTMTGAPTNSIDTPDMLAVSVYDDTKPVHLMPTVGECVERVVKQRKVWSMDSGEIKTMSF
jgi:hypothetical protein